MALTTRAEAWKGGRNELDEICVDLQQAYWQLEEYDDVDEAADVLLAHVQLPVFHRAQLSLYRAALAEDDETAEEFVRDARYWINDMEVHLEVKGLNDPRLTALKKQALNLLQQLRDKSTDGILPLEAKAAQGQLPEAVGRVMTFEEKLENIKQGIRMEHELQRQKKEELAKTGVTHHQELAAAVLASYGLGTAKEPEIGKAPEVGQRQRTRTASAAAGVDAMKPDSMKPPPEGKASTGGGSVESAFGAQNTKPKFAFRPLHGDSKTPHVEKPYRNPMRPQKPVKPEKLRSASGSLLSAAEVTDPQNTSTPTIAVHPAEAQGEVTQFGGSKDADQPESKTAAAKPPSLNVTPFPQIPAGGDDGDRPPTPRTPGGSIRKDASLPRNSRYRMQAANASFANRTSPEKKKGPSLASMFNQGQDSKKDSEEGASGNEKDGGGHDPFTDRGRKK